MKWYQLHCGFGLVLNPKSYHGSIPNNQLIIKLNQWSKNTFSPEQTRCRNIFTQIPRRVNSTTCPFTCTTPTANLFILFAEVYPFNQWVDEKIHGNKNPHTQKKIHAIPTSKIPCQQWHQHTSKWKSTRTSTTKCPNLGKKNNTQNRSVDSSIATCGFGVSI